MSLSDIYYNKVYGCYLANLTVGKKYRIDFVNQGESKYESGSIINTPGEAVSNIYIRCDGPAPIQFSLNAPNINEMIGGYLTTGMYRDMKFKKPSIKSINFYIHNNGSASFADISVEVIK